MNIEKFQAWCSSKGVPEAAYNAVLKAVSGNAHFEEIVDTAVNDDASFITLIAGLSRPDPATKATCDIKPIIKIYRESMTPVASAAPKPTVSVQPKGDSQAASSEQAVERPAAKKKFPDLGAVFGSKKKPSMGVGPKVGGSGGKKPSKKMIMIAGAVIVLVLLGLIGFFVVSSGNSSKPGGSGISDPGSTFVPDPTEAPRVDENGKKIEWFAVAPEELDTTEPFLVKPASFLDFINKVPWRWLLWIVFFIPMFSLLGKDRFSSGERTDIGTVVLGLVILLVTVLLTEPLGVLVTWISHQIGSPIEAPSVWINLVGVLVNLGVQWSATSSGKRDYSAFAIAGLFATGAVLIWWNPTVTITIIIGAIFMLGGLVLQAHEMGRSRQGGQAVFVALLMLGVFAVTMVIWQVFCWGVSYIPQPESEVAAKILGFLAWFLVSSKTWMSGIIAILVVLGTGDMIASAIMPPRRPTSHQADSYPDQNDREKRQEIDSRYDAMVFAIMLLYPIAVVVWEAIRVFGLI